MPDGLHLYGADDVRSAGNRISQAAETISRAAATFDEAVYRLIGAMQEGVRAADRLSDVMEREERRREAERG